MRPTVSHSRAVTALRARSTVLGPSPRTLLRARGAAQLVEQSFAFALDPLGPSEIVVGLGLGEILVQICNAAPELGPRPGVEHRDGAVLPRMALSARSRTCMSPRAGPGGREVVEALGVTEPGKWAAVLDAPRSRRRAWHRPRHHRNRRPGPRSRNRPACLTVSRQPPS